MPILRLDRANPNLEDLLLAAQIGIGCKLKHAARKVLDVRVIAIIQPARFAQALIEVAVTGTMLAKIRSDHCQGRPIFVGAGRVNRKAERDGC